ncbi:MAG: SprT-like domain-containing protein [Acutalibacteraceae bacterium]
MKDVNAIFEKVKAQAKALNIPFSTNIAPNVEINTRAMQRFGMCRKTGDTFTIEIAEVLLSADEFFIEQTLAHELLHTCRGCQNHGTLWQQYADRLNRAYGYHISRTNSYEEMGIEAKKHECKYRMQCMKCGVIVERYRMSGFVSHPEKYLCRCGGKWKRIL